MLYAAQCVLNLTGIPSLPEPRKAVLRKLSDPSTGDAIDHSLVLWFPGMHVCMELSVHYSRVLELEVYSI